MPAAPGGGRAAGNPGLAAKGPAARAGINALPNGTPGLLGPITSTRAMRAVTGIFAPRTGPVGGPANYGTDQGRIVRTS